MKARRSVFLKLNEIKFYTFYTPVIPYHIVEKNLSKTKACYKGKVKKRGEQYVAVNKLINEIKRSLSFLPRLSLFLSGFQRSF